MKVGYQLPTLDKRRTAIVRRCYMAVAAVVLVLLVGNLSCDAVLFLSYQPAAVHYGLSLGSNDEDEPLVSVAWPEVGTPPVEDDSRVVAIDDKPLKEGATMLTEGRIIARAGATLILDLRDHAGNVTRRAFKRGIAGGWRRYPDDGAYVILWSIEQTLTEVIVDIVPLLISFALFRRKTSDPEAMLLAFAFLMMATSAGNGGWVSDFGLPAPALWGKLTHAFVVAGWTSMLFGICCFPDGKFVTRWSRCVALIPPVFAIISIFFPRLRPHGLTERWVAAATYLLCIGSLVLRYRLLPPGNERQQIKWALLGAVVMAVAGVLAVATNLPLLSGRFGPFDFVVEDLLFLLKELAFPLGLFVSLVRFRLYDADDVISRTAGYGGLTLALLAVFAGSEQLAQSTSQQFLGDSLGNWSSGVGAAVAALTLAPMHNRIMHWTERHLRTKLAVLREEIPLMLASMRETATPQVLAEATLERIAQGSRARCAAIVRDGAIIARLNVSTAELETWLKHVIGEGNQRVRESDRADKLFPIRIVLADEQGKTGSWLLVGPRPDGTLYPHDEREALSDLAGVVANSLAIAGEKRQRDAKRDQEVDTLRDHIAGLERELRKLSGRFDGTETQAE